LPYVRTVKTSSGATAVQIVYSFHRGSRDIEHIGSAHDDAELELLKAVARQRLAAGQGELDLGLDAGAPGGPLPIAASRMECLLDALEQAWRVRREAASLRELLDEQARLHARRVIDTRQLAVGSAELRIRLDQVESVLAQAARVSPLDGIAGRSNAAELWAALDLGRRREILRALATVTVLPANRGCGFDPDSVQITWHR